MIAQLTGFIACSFCFIILGSVVRKIAGWNISYTHDFLIGLALSNAIFTAISLGYPINNTAAFLFAVSVILLLLSNLTYERIYFRRLVNLILLRSRKSPVLFSIVSVLILLTFFQSLYSPSLHYDAGLYHVPAIKWTAEHKAIRGLVHLNAFLGYNFNIFSLDAAFYGLYQQPIYPINFTVISFFLLWIGTKISYAIESNYYVLAASYVLIGYYLLLNFWPHVSTPSNDILVFVLSTTLLISGIDLEKNRDLIFSGVIISVYAITIKLSAAPVLLLAVYLVSTKQFWSHRKQATLTLLISGFVLLPWLIKTVLLTGWLLFPFPLIDLFSFEWKLPMPEVVQLKESIRNFYIPGGDSRSSWVQSWLFNQNGIDLAVIVLSAGAILALFARLLVKKKQLSTDYLAIIGVSIFGIVFMCVYSPSLRYSVAFFLATILLSVNAFKFRGNGSQFGFYAFGLIVVFTFLKDNWFHPWHFTKNITHRFLLPYPLILKEKKEYAYFLIDRKIKCYYPVASNQCFDHLLPCASRRVDRLHLRGEGIDQGFYRDAR